MSQERIAKQELRETIETIVHLIELAFQDSGNLNGVCSTWSKAFGLQLYFNGRWYGKGVETVTTIIVDNITASSEQKVSFRQDLALALENLTTKVFTMMEACRFRSASIEWLTSSPLELRADSIWLGRGIEVIISKLK